MLCIFQEDPYSFPVLTAMTCEKQRKENQLLDNCLTLLYAIREDLAISSFLCPI